MEAAVARPFNVPMSRRSFGERTSARRSRAVAAPRFEASLKRARQSCGHRFCAGEPGTASRRHLVWWRAPQPSTLLQAVPRHLVVPGEPHALVALHVGDQRVQHPDP